jgi:hypothetical protein
VVKALHHKLTKHQKLAHFWTEDFFQHYILFRMDKKSTREFLHSRNQYVFMQRIHDHKFEVSSMDFFTGEFSNRVDHNDLGFKQFTASIDNDWN